MSNKNIILYALWILIIPLCIACNQSVEQLPAIPQEKATTVQALDFNKDSAYYFVEKQVSFGPRVPNTKAHKECGMYLLQTLQQFADTVMIQSLSIKAYNGAMLNGQNIIGIFNPDARKRVLLAAHWDSRPYADHDPNPENRRIAIDGANDGASGVGVLLEIARQLQAKTPAIGIDIVFFDLEDYGEPQDERQNNGDFWCLGSQAWAKNPHVKNYRAKYGILLDMVGGHSAQFTKEGFSRQYAPDIVDKVWNRANTLGFSSYFQNRETAPILDDHFYVNNIRNLPMIDVIEWDETTGTGFNKHWHTVNDNMDNINRETLSVVGKLVLSVVYGEE